MDNLEIYNKYRSVPDNAKKPITAGRLKGMTDINPMWRIKSLTEAFGPCGIGWYVEPVSKWLDNGANGEIIANVEINLYIKVGGEWSKPIYGIGGAKAVSKEKSGAYTDDDCYKKAYTDAISIACKALGFAADVYYQKDCTKYTYNEQQKADEEQKADEKPKADVICPKCGKAVNGVKIRGVPYQPPQVLEMFGMCGNCYKKAKANEQTNVQT